uniref:Uncharacterized protein n=1 Tax=Eptatretus burgeri TaxID=7764 RepID=A0A8C4Q6H7_EPTBU
MVPVIPLLFCLLLPAAWASARVEEEKQDKLGFMNLAAGASVTASATCGVDEKGHSRPDLYCRVGGAVHDAERLTLQGQVCEVCEAGSTELSYPATSVTDGTDRGWQSPPLSLGSKYETVNLSLAFGQLFRVAKVSIWFGLAPRPRRWVIERSTDFGKTFSPWQFFAGSSKECVEYFGVPRSPLSQQGNEVICNTEYSNALLENNLVVVSLLRSWKMESTSNQLPLELRMFTQATDLRLRFLAMDTLPGHKEGKHERDPAIKRYYYYSVKEIAVLGSCECHDHASSCTALDRDDPFKFHCSCSHQTEGMNCERCKPGFYRQRASPTAPNVCTPCQCHGPGTNGSCFAESGNCICRTGFEGKSCEHCAHGYRGFPDCQMRSQKHVETWQHTEQHPNTKCSCAGVGSLAGKCDPETGRCRCHVGFTGEHCDKCANGYFNFPLCQLCQCSPSGTTSQVCDQAGKCLCRSEVTGSQCDQCRSGYYTFPYCNVCDCDQVGAIGSVCGSGGQCECRQSVDGRRCDRCAAGHFSFPNCWRCECSQEGSISLECDSQSGECLCRSGVTGHRCDRCIAGLFGFPSCQTHTCDPAGSLSTDHDNMDTCRCRTNVLGQTCSSCKPLFWNLQWENPTGCQSCHCNTNGTIGGYAECNQFTGQCLCKPGVTGRTCDQCLPGYYSSHGASYFGCQSCNCDAGGSVDLSCDAVTGACTCRPGVTGLKCNKLQPGFFLPGPQNWRYEAEAAVGPKGHQLRIENSMTGFTGTGYVTLERLQVQAIWKVEVGFGKVSLFSVVLRCMTQNANPVLGKITLSPVNHPGSNQSHEVQILGGADDDWRSVSPSAEPFLLTPGEWELSIETTHLVLDSVLLLPSLQDLAGTPVFSRPFVQPCLLHPPANISTHLYDSHNWPNNIQLKIRFN